MSHNTRVHKIILALVLTFTLVLPALASAEPTTAAHSSLLQTVHLTNQSYLEIKDVQLLPGGGNTITAFTVTWHNGESQKMNIRDYFIRLKSSSGIDVVARVLPTENDSIELGPKSAVTYHYYAKTGANTKLTDMYFDVLKWNFAASNFQQSVAKVKIPGDYSASAPAGATKNLVANGNQYDIRLSSAGLTSNDTYLFPILTLEVTNQENAGLPLPDLQYNLRTDKGLMYPLKLSDTANIQLKPLETQNLVLTGSIPVSAGTSGWELVAVEKQASGADAFDYPVASLRFAPTSLAQGALNKTYVYQNDDGAYTLSLDHIYRLPWEDDDILTADITILNNSKQSLPILNLNGSFLMDGRVKVEASYVLLDKMISIQPGQEQHVRLVGKVPYTNLFDRLSVRLGDADKQIDVVEFGPIAELNEIPVVAATASYPYAGTGNQIELKVQEAGTLTGISSDIYMAQIDLRNLEKRFTQAPGLSGHFKAADGNVFPAVMEKVSEKSMPGGKAILQAWTTIPKGFDTAGMRLVIGKSITGGKLSALDSVPDGYIEPVDFVLPSEPPKAQDGLKDIAMGPFTLSITHYNLPFFIFNKSAYELTFRFEYNLTRDFLTQANMSNHRYLLEIEDGNGDVIVSSPFQFSPDQADSGEKLDTGMNKKYEWKQDVSNISFKSTAYTLKIYDLFNSGYKRLLASQSLD